MSEQSKNYALKQCPFCGGETKLEVTITNVSIKCVECDARIIKIITVRDQPDVDYFKSLAIEEWNKRQNKWISVKDKLPENKQVVLVITKQGEMAVCECEKDYQYLFILLDTNLQIRDVTHWMNLPEPPK